MQLDTEEARAQGLRGDQIWGSQGVLCFESVHTLMDVLSGREGTEHTKKKW